MELSLRCHVVDFYDRRLAISTLPGTALTQKVRSSFSLFNYYPQCKFISNQVTSADQGACQLSYASVIAQTLAFHYCANSEEGKYVELSPQNIVNCRLSSLGVVTKPDYEKFCPSFNMLSDFEKALNFVKTIGIQTAKVDPYFSGRDGLLTRCSRTAAPYVITDFTLLTSTDFNSVAGVLMGGQPVLAVLTRSQASPSYSRNLPCSVFRRQSHETRW